MSDVPKGWPPPGSAGRRAIVATALAITAPSLGFASLYALGDALGSGMAAAGAAVMLSLVIAAVGVVIWLAALALAVTAHRRREVGAGRALATCVTPAVIAALATAAGMWLR